MPNSTSLMTKGKHRPSLHLVSQAVEDMHQKVIYCFCSVKQNDLCWLNGLVLIENVGIYPLAFVSGSSLQNLRNFVQLSSSETLCVTDIIFGLAIVVLEFHESSGYISNEKREGN